MKKLLLIATILILYTGLYAQSDSSSNQANQKYSKQESSMQNKQNDQSSFKMNKFFFGGSLGFSFGSVTSIRINPLVGYNLTPKLSAGITGLYEYNSYDYRGEKQKFSNYGGSVFSRFKIIPQLYAHAEFSFIDYEFVRLNNEKYRVGVPFLFLGGGYAQRIGRNTYAYMQILFDVLQDSNSPYEEWTPFYSVGVSVGF